MAQILSYSYNPEHPNAINTIRYGKCETSQYAQNDLWFVNISREPPHISGAKDEHTFFVTGEIATPEHFQAWRRDLEKWKEAAVSFVTGSWNPIAELLYKDVPINEHILSDGGRILYGVSGIQPHESYLAAGLGTSVPFKKEQQQRVLDYVISPAGYLFLVDHILCTQGFLARMDSDDLLWMLLCWHMEAEDHGNDMYASFVRTRTVITLDSPYRPEELEDIDRKIERYKALREKFLSHFVLRDVDKPFRVSLHRRTSILDSLFGNKKSEVEWNDVFLYTKRDLLEAWANIDLKTFHRA